MSRGEYGARILHRGTVERAVLANQCAAVHANDVVVGEGLCEHGSRLLVMFQLRVGGIEYGTVEDEIVGVGCGKAFAVGGKDWVGEGQFQETEGFSLGSAEGAEFFPHGVQLLKMFIGGIGKSYIYNGVIGCQTRQCVDVGVRVVACQIAVVQPEEAVHAEPFGERGFALRFRQSAVAVRVAETAGGGEQRAASVGFDAAALQFIVQTVHIVSFHLREDVTVHCIVLLRFKLSAPASEAEVQQFHLRFVEHGEESVVSDPRVIGGAGDDADAVADVLRHFLSEEFCQRFGLWRRDEEWFSGGYGEGETEVAFRHFLQHGHPVRVFVRPRDLDATLWKPFGQERSTARESVLFGSLFWAEEDGSVQIVAQGGGDRGGKWHGR